MLKLVGRQAEKKEVILSGFPFHRFAPLSNACVENASSVSVSNDLDTESIAREPRRCILNGGPRTGEPEEREGPDNSIYKDVDDICSIFI